MKNPVIILKNYIIDPHRKRLVRQVADIFTCMCKYKLGVYSYFYSSMHKKSSGPIQNYCTWKEINEVGKWQLGNLEGSDFTNDKVEFYKKVSAKGDLLSQVLGFFESGNFYSSKESLAPVSISDKPQILQILKVYLQEHESLFLKVSHSN